MCDSTKYKSPNKELGKNGTLTTAVPPLFHYLGGWDKKRGGRGGVVFGAGEAIFKL